MKTVLELIDRVGPSDANVLITGENGTGKGVVARTLHAVSSRAGRPMVTVNVGGLSEGVFESELFGHVKGAYTDAKTDRVGRFELADGGTLFLDEIANIPNSQQRKLLRVLETGEFERVGSSKTKRAHVRILSATNSDLAQEVSEGRFRQDLLFRLNTIELHLPPLRDRRADIESLAMTFLRQHARAIHGRTLVPWRDERRRGPHRVSQGIETRSGIENLPRERYGTKSRCGYRRSFPGSKYGSDHVEAGYRVAFSSRPKYTSSGVRAPRTARGIFSLCSRT